MQKKQTHIRGLVYLVNGVACRGGWCRMIGFFLVLLALCLQPVQGLALPDGARGGGGDAYGGGVGADAIFANPPLCLNGGQKDKFPAHSGAKHPGSCPVCATVCCAPPLGMVPPLWDGAWGCVFVRAGLSALVLVSGTGHDHWGLGPRGPPGSG